MIGQALVFLAETAFGLMTLALLLRFFLQLFRAPHRNPISQFVNALTNFVVLPARRIVPGLWGMDLATLTAAWLSEVVLTYVVLALRGVSPSGGAGVVFAVIALLALVKLMKIAIYIIMVSVIVQALLSWINPYSPIAPLLASFSDPFLRPLQRRIPNVGNVDLSPLILVVILQLMLMVPIAWLEANVGRIV